MRPTDKSDRHETARPNPPSAPGSADGAALFSQALEHHGAGRLAEAQQLYQRILKTERAHGGALHNLGILALQRGESDQALTLFHQAIAVNPKDATALRNLASLQRSRGDLEAAIASFEHAIAARPGWAQPRRNLIETLLAAGNKTEVEPALKRFLEVQGVLGDPRNDGQPRKVLALYGLDNPDFVIQHRKAKADFSFSINSGHFKIEDVIDHGEQSLFRAFLGPRSDLARIRGQLAGADLIINCIADPELETRSLRAARSLLTGGSKPVINAPDTVLGTARDQITDRLRSFSGVVAPKTLRLRANTKGALDEIAAADIDFPVIVRPVESQTGIDMHKVADASALEESLAAFAGRQVFLIAFHDFQDPGDGLFRKMRLFGIDGRLYPEHRLILDHWNLHSADRLKLMRDDRRLRLEEVAFLEDYRATIGDRAATALDALPDALGLDFFGVDFAVLPNGDALIFEANPAMRINLDFVGDFPYQAGYLARITDAFKAMVNKRLGDA